eukprot:1145401-Pelagomonas_calceolata.AAC.19
MDMGAFCWLMDLMPPAPTCEEGSCTHNQVEFVSKMPCTHNQVEFVSVMPCTHCHVEFVPMMSGTNRHTQPCVFSVMLPCVTSVEQPGRHSAAPRALERSRPQHPLTCGWVAAGLNVRNCTAPFAV